MKNECILCGEEFEGKSNQYFCKKCKKAHRENYLYTITKIRRGEFTKDTAKQIKDKLDLGKYKKDICKDLDINPIYLNHIMKYFYPDYNIESKLGRKIKENENWNGEKHNDYHLMVKKEIVKLNDKLVPNTDICTMLGIKYSNFKNYGLELQNVNKCRDVYPYRYKNLEDIWYYCNIINNKKIVLKAESDQELIKKIKEAGLSKGRKLFKQ